MLSQPFVIFFALGVELQQVVFEELEDHVELVGHLQGLLEFDDIAVCELAQRLYLAQLDALVPVGVFLLELLYCNGFAGLRVCGLVDDPEGAVAQLLRDLVLVHYYLFSWHC